MSHTCNSISTQGRTDFLCVLLSLLAFFAIAGIAPAASQSARKPNVILIMADDLGAEGLGCYNSSIYHTPNLDTMSREGVLFENGYATPLCTPTRVMIMTGIYPQKTGFRNLIGKDKEDRMPASLKTFGTYFKEAGYATAMAGKWQLGQFDVFPNQPTHWLFSRLSAPRGPLSP